VVTKLRKSLDEFLTVAEAAKVRGVSRAAIHELIQRGRLRSETLLGRIVVYKNEIKEFEKDKPGPKAKR